MYSDKTKSNSLQRDNPRSKKEYDILYRKVLIGLDYKDGLAVDVGKFGTKNSLSMTVTNPASACVCVCVCECMCV